MDSKALLMAEPLFLSPPRGTSFRRHFPCLQQLRRIPAVSISDASRSLHLSRKSNCAAVIRRCSTTLMANSTSSKSGVYTVGDFMTKRDQLKVVKPSTTLDEALECLVDNRITGFPVVDDDWKLASLQHLRKFNYSDLLDLIFAIFHVGVVSDYDLLALDSISGTASADTSMFPEVDSSWKVFNELQKLLSKTNGRVVADVMTQAPVVVHETTHLEDAAKLLLETRYRRLPVVDSEGKLVGIITRGNVVRAALQIKREAEKQAQ
ncbi:hypothetical protein Cgig2_010369 [Carnegiea gigantea]|uniref:CBS domain-containing protein n=1 Tax=Carnegiea gigantea TaxID=171969 RepID=A0A9Q1QCU2_9CARY|nr:hypothetical protein Cgig2_010369 [Carnegiea gigantea]